VLKPGCAGIVVFGNGVNVPPVGGAVNVPGRGARLGGASAGVIIVRVPGCTVGGGGIVVVPPGMNPRGIDGITFVGDG